MPRRRRTTRILIAWHTRCIRRAQIRARKADHAIAHHYDRLVDAETR